MAEWLAVISITIFAVISPGPDFAMTSRNSLLLSRRAGLLTALGIGAGVLVHVCYTLLGVGVLMTRSPMLFDVLKLVGSAYLIYLGVRMLRATPGSGGDIPPQMALTGIGALKVGFLTNALNPKTTLFIVSLFMQVVQSTTPLEVQIGYGLFIAMAHVLWFSLVAVFFAAPGIRARILRVRHWIDRAFGALLIFFGIGLVLANMG